MLENIHEKRFIGRNDNDSFTTKMSIQEFHKAVEKHNKGNIISPYFPTKKNLKSYLNSLRKMRAYLLKAEQDEIDKALKNIKDKFSPKLDVFDKQIKKLDSIIFLEQELGIKVCKPRNKSKPKSLEASSSS